VFIEGRRLPDTGAMAAIFLCRQCFVSVARPSVAVDFLRIIAS
jgi:hypothetical protein